MIITEADAMFHQPQVKTNYVADKKKLALTISNVPENILDHHQLQGNSTVAKRFIFVVRRDKCQLTDRFI